MSAATLRLGELIRRRRKELGITQEKLAIAVEVGPTYISKIERSEQRGSYEVLARISVALKIPWADFIRTGEVRIPSLDSPQTDDGSIYPALDEMFTMYHPRVKEILIDIAVVLNRHLGLAPTDREKNIQTETLKTAIQALKNM